MGTSTPSSVRDRKRERKEVAATEEDLLGAVSGAAHGRELFTEEDLLGAVGGAARGCELFHGRLPARAVSGAAGSCGRETASIGELSLLRAVLSEVDEIIFGMGAHPARMVCDSSSHAEPTAIPGKGATSFSPSFLLLSMLVAAGRPAHCSQQVVFSTKARSHELLRSRPPSS